MKYLFASVISVLLLAFPVLSHASNAPTWVSNSPTPLPKAIREKADEYAGGVVAKGKRASMVVGVMIGEKRWILGYGETSLGSNTPPNGDTLYEIGSVTKTFTSTALALMVKNGRMKLNDPVSKYLPKGTRVPSYKGKIITLARLASHTSGLPGLPDDFLIANILSPENPYDVYSPEKSYEFLANYELDRAPGSLYEYSNFGAGLLGMALSRVNRSSYQRMILDMICRPLGMRDTIITLNKDQQARLAPAYRLTGSDEKPTLNPTANWTFQDNFAGAGAIRSTANDLLTYIAANTGVKKTPLRGAFDLTHKPRHKTKIDGIPVSLGLGWHIMNKPEWFCHPIICHAGGTGGYNSYVAFDTVNKVGVVVLGNGTRARAKEDPEESTAGCAVMMMLSPPKKSAARR